MARKKKGGHHGGAWKVAYADFVTAMMALFMVLWIIGQDESIVEATSSYFQNPLGTSMDVRSGLFEFIRSPSDAELVGEDEGAPDRDSNELDIVFLNSVAQDFYRLLNIEEGLEDRPIDIQVTSDGIRITLYDRRSEPLFQPLTADFTEWGMFAMQNLAWVIARHNFNLVIEGHTVTGLELPRHEYTAWELSSDRANAARRMLSKYASGEIRTERVVGLADRSPVPDLPIESESNQRVTLSLSPRNSAPRNHHFQ